MALFPQTSTTFTGKSQTNLVISENFQLTGKFIPSAAETTKFQYAFAPVRSNPDVVIPKGKILTTNGLEWDAFTSHYQNAVKICGAGGVPIGVNAYNVYKRIRDIDEGNIPLVLTGSYIELPLFGTEAAANAIKWGAAWATGAGTTITNIVGKYLKADQYGNFTPMLVDGTCPTCSGAGWIAKGSETVGVSTDDKILCTTCKGKGTISDPERYMIGLAVAAETDVPMEGFLQFFLDQSDSEWAKAIKAAGVEKAPGKSPTQIGTYDIASFPFLSAAHPQIRGWDQGIQYLTDGYFRAKKAVASISLDNVDFDYAGGLALYASTEDQYGQVVNIRTMGPVTIAGAGSAADPKKVTVAADYRGAALRIMLKDKICTDEPGLAVYTVAENGTATQVAAADISLDLDSNTIIIYFNAALDADRIKINVNLLIDQTPGITTNSDFAACLGLVRVKLMK